MHAWVSPYLADVKKVMGGGGEGVKGEREREMCNKEKIQEWKTTDKKKNLNHLEKKPQNLKPELKQWCDVKMQRTITTK